MFTNKDFKNEPPKIKCILGGKICNILCYFFAETLLPLSELSAFVVEEAAGADAEAADDGCRTLSRCG